MNIPKSCGEDWNKTTIHKKEIQHFFTINQRKNVYQHFKRKELDTIVVQIPETVFPIQLLFQNICLVTLFFLIGITMFSCKIDKSETQKNNKEVLLGSVDNTAAILKTNGPTKCENLLLVTEVEIEYDESITIPPPIKYIKAPELRLLGGIQYLEATENVTIASQALTYSFNVVQTPPRFNEKKAFFNIGARRKFNKKMQKLVAQNFDESLATKFGLSKGNYTISSNFIINDVGEITAIQIKVSDEKLEAYTRDFIKKLPQFIPAKEKGENVAVRYTLPISFTIK